MNDRRDILQDVAFWNALEFGLSGWFRTCGDHALGGLWCDGFSPVSARNTKEGIDVSGTAWVVEGQKSHHQCSFTVSIPQRMLARRRSEIEIADVVLDLDHRRIAFSVKPAIQLSTSDSQQ